MGIFIPAFTTWHPSDVPQAFDFNNQIRGTLLLRSHPPAVSVRNATNLTVPDSTQTLMTWDTNEFDSDTMHPPGSATPSRLTAQTIGRYRVMASVVWIKNDTKAHQIMIRKNSGGSATGGAAVGIGAKYGSDNVLFEQASSFASAEVILGQGDYVECFVYQASGSSSTVSHSVNQASRFGAVWIAIG
uniref:hypothetical protein n=1 Tax=Pseudonocardia sp. CA-138482 TaxID=3240023 RepID=UPI003F4915F3